MRRPTSKALAKPATRLFWPFLTLALLGCTGNVIGEPGGGDTSFGNPGVGHGAAGATPRATPQCADGNRLPSRIRAMNGEQYLNSIRAAFPSSAELTNPFSNSDRSSEYSTNAELRRFDFNTSGAIGDNAELIAKGATAELLMHYACLNQASDAGCVSGMITNLGRKLYRAPVSDSQIAKLSALFEQARVLTGAEAAAGLVLRAMLSSPHFLFHKELGAATSDPAALALTSHEVANALAFALTNAPPDSLLQAAADSDSLKTPEQLAAQAERVLALPEGLRGLLVFMNELFRTRDLAAKQKDAALFPAFDAETRSQLASDFSDTISSILRSGTPTFETLLTTRNFVVRPRTAAAMGWTSLPGVTEQGTLSTIPETERLGILMHPALLATFAHPDETNPVARGHFISSKLLGVVIPPPPQAVVFPERPADGTPRTLRQVIASQHSAEACAGCHQLMDSVGYPFEVFDAVGKFRTTDNGLPIDATGEINGTNEIDGPVQGAEELMRKLASSNLAHERFVGNFFKYVAGVDESPRVYCMTSVLAQQFKQGGGDIRKLIVSLLTSDARSRIQPSEG